MTQQRSREHGGDGGDEEEVEITVRGFGLDVPNKLQAKRGERLSEVLRKHGITKEALKGRDLLLNTEQIPVDEEGLLERDPEITENSTLEIIRQRFIAG